MTRFHLNNNRYMCTSPEKHRHRQVDCKIPKKTFVLLVNKRCEVCSVKRGPNSLWNNLSKLKTFADNKINVTQKSENQHFLLFKWLLSHGHSKSRLCGNGLMHLQSFLRTHVSLHHLRRLASGQTFHYLLIFRKSKIHSSSQLRCWTEWI